MSHIARSNKESTDLNSGKARTGKKPQIHEGS
jgi:hypothetical protein